MSNAPQPMEWAATGDSLRDMHEASRNAGRPPLSPHGSPHLHHLDSERRRRHSDNSAEGSPQHPERVASLPEMTSRSLVEITLPRHRNSNSSLARSVPSRRTSGPQNSMNASANQLQRGNSDHSLNTEPAARRTTTNTPTAFVWSMPAAAAPPLGADLQRRNEEQARRAVQADASLAAQRGGSQATTQATRGRSRGDATTDRNVYVSGLPATTSDEVLRALFEEYGSVESVRICRHTDPTRGAQPYGFVLMTNRVNADNAIRELNNRTFDGSRLQVRLATRGPNVSPASTQRPRSESPASHIAQPHHTPTSTAPSATSYAATGYSSQAVGHAHHHPQHPQQQHQQSQQPHQQQYVYFPVTVPGSSGAPTVQPPPVSQAGLPNPIDLNALLAQRADLWARLQQVDADIQRIVAQYAARFAQASYGGPAPYSSPAPYSAPSPSGAYAYVYSSQPSTAPDTRAHVATARNTSPPSRANSGWTQIVP
jgi:hypothetical protein